MCCSPDVGEEERRDVASRGSRNVSFSLAPVHARSIVWEGRMLCNIQYSLRHYGFEDRFGFKRGVFKSDHVVNRR